MISYSINFPDTLHTHTTGSGATTLAAILNNEMSCLVSPFVASSASTSPITEQN